MNRTGIITTPVPHPPLRGTFPQEGKENKEFPSSLGRLVAELPSPGAAEPLKRGQGEGFAHSKGFTLIELVLALALAAVLASVLGGVLRGAVGTWRNMRETSRARQRAHALSDRLGRDLRNSLSIPGETFKGSSKEIYFNTLVDASATPGSLETVPRLSRVSYREEFTSAGAHMVRDQQHYSTVPDVETLAQRVVIPAEVKFSYAYWGGPDSRVLWEDVWVDTGTFPRAIKAELVFSSQKGPIRYESVFQIPLGVLPPWNK